MMMPETTSPRQNLETLAVGYCQEPSETVLEEIVEAGAGLVYHFARPHSDRCPLEDLTQAGYEGLIKALQKFDPERKVRFSTYASYYIKGEIWHELQRNSIYEKPSWLADIRQKVFSAIDDLRQTLHREPSLQEIAEAVNIEEDGVVQALLAGCIPLEEIDISRIKNIRYESFQLPIEDQVWLQDGISKLSEVQQKVIYLIFYHDLTQTKVAELLGTNQRRVSRLLKRGLEQLALYLLG